MVLTREDASNAGVLTYEGLCFSSMWILPVLIAICHTTPQFTHDSMGEKAMKKIFGMLKL